jgi:2-dehydropantoate 2-reductase
MTDQPAPTTRPVIVYGVGAVGGVIAARLRLAGFDVTAVARGHHLETIRSRGLRLVTQQDAAAVDLPAARDAGEIDWSTAPVVLLAVKSHQTAAAVDDLAAHAPADTPVFAVQNGVANEAAILRRFADVYGVIVAMPTAHLEPGVVIQQCHPVAGILDIGRYPGGRDALAEEMASTLRAAQFSSEVRDDIMAWKHRKLIANLGNGVTAAFRPGPAADELTARARREAEQILVRAGIPFVTAEQDRARRGDLLSGKLRDEYYGSTWQSITRGHSDVEIDWLNGEIVLQARLLGLSAPVNEFLQRITAEHARRGSPPRSRDAAEALAELPSPDPYVNR